MVYVLASLFTASQAERSSPARGGLWHTMSRGQYWNQNFIRAWNAYATVDPTVGIYGSTPRILSVSGQLAISPVLYESLQIKCNADRNFSPGLGHCRLSIVDLSAGGDQPLHDGEDKIHAVVMGEVYDDEALREHCIQEFGYVFHGHSDSELVIALYKHYGAPEFLNHLRGEFAFVIYDERSAEVIAARDRFGIKPMFWTVVGDQLLLAPEIKAFLPLGWKPEWDVDSLALDSCFVGSATCFKGIKRVSRNHTAPRLRLMAQMATH